MIDILYTGISSSAAAIGVREVLRHGEENLSDSTTLKAQLFRRAAAEVAKKIKSKEPAKEGSPERRTHTLR